MLDNLQICIVGNSKVGKKTIINAFSASNTAIFNNNIIPEDFLYAHDKLNVCFSTITITGDSVDISNNDAHIYLYIVDWNNIKRKQYDLNIIEKLKQTIDTSPHKHLFVAVNKCDSFDLVNMSLNEEYNKYEAFVIALAQYNLKPYPLIAKKLFISRYLYYNIGNDITIEIEIEIQNKIKLLIGEMSYRKYKIASCNLREKQTILIQNYGLEEIYQTDMTETGYYNLIDGINYYVDTYYDVICKHNIACELKLLSNNNDIIQKSNRLIKLIDSIDYDDEEYSELYNYIENDYYTTIKQLLLDPTKIDINIIRIINDVNDKLNEKYNVEILTDIIIEIDSMRIDKLIDHFRCNYDINVIKEISNKLTPKILDQSLLSTIYSDNLSFDVYVQSIQLLCNISDDIDIHATIIKYITYYIDYTIVNEYLLLSNSSAPDINNVKCNYINYIIKNNIIKNNSINTFDEYVSQSKNMIIMNELFSKNIINNVHTNINSVTVMQPKGTGQSIPLVCSIDKSILPEVMMDIRLNTTLTIADLRKHVYDLDKTVFKNITMITSLVKQFTDLNPNLNNAKIAIDTAYGNGQLLLLYEQIAINRKNKCKNTDTSSHSSQATVDVIGIVPVNNTDIVSDMITLETIPTSSKKPRGKKAAVSINL